VTEGTNRYNLDTCTTSARSYLCDYCLFVFAGSLLAEQFNKHNFLHDLEMFCIVYDRYLKFARFI
jgi:hypothetical protein